MRLAGKIALIIFIKAIFLFSSSAQDVIWPETVIESVPAKIKISTGDGAETSTITINGRNFEPEFQNGQYVLETIFYEKQEVVVRINQQSFTKEIRPIPLWLSILPPLLAIAMAIAFKEVISALFTGLFSGAFILEFYSQGNLLTSFFISFINVTETLILQAFMNEDHVLVIIFSMLIGGMVKIISDNGGMAGIVRHLSKYARSPRSGQFITWVLGMLIFFDDYSNTMIVGNTMKPVTDRLKISREKLAYLVDSTAAPIASIAFISTWIGVELSYINEGIDFLGLETSAYSIFMHSLKYSFYPVFALALMLFLIIRKVDFGSMYKYESYARKNQAQFELNQEKSKVSGYDWALAAIPVFALITGTFLGLLYTGIQSATLEQNQSLALKVSTILGEANSYKALVWASTAGILIAVGLSVAAGKQKLTKAMESSVEGFKIMLVAMIILIMAWALSDITAQLRTADFIMQSLDKINLQPGFLPLLSFLISALVAFSTGSSWGTMAIIYPIILPASWHLGAGNMLGVSENYEILYMVTASVLGGAVLGDHCSPISDTTILSSLSSQCNHINHVKSQMPYAITAGIVSTGAGYFLTGIGLPFYFSMTLGLFALWLIVRFLGKKTD